MKKLFLLSTLLFLAAANLSAQTRECGTMDYLELRKKQDPTLEQRMNDAEAAIREWSNKNPVAVKTPVSFPYVPGFIPTGNEASDRVAYANAKQRFLAQHPSGKGKTSLSSDDKLLREKKRQTNTFIKN